MKSAADSTSSRPVGAETMNSRLRDLYARYWSTLAAAIPKNAHYSAPILISASEAYANADLRLMVVGQQTNTWWGADGWDASLRESAPIDALLRRYAEFELGKAYPGPFWSAAHTLQRQLGSEGTRCGLIWSNLNRVDRALSKKDPNARATAIEEALGRIPLLEGEIRILQPHVLIFFIGPAYDARLRATFPGVEVAKPTKREPLQRATHANLAQFTFSTYHPNFLQRAKLLRRVLGDIVRTVRARPAERL